MPPENKQNEQKFDLMLKKTLKKHQELPRRGFSEKLISEVKMLEQQNALRKVIWQERLLLTGVILFPTTAIAAFCAYPVILFESLQLFERLALLANAGVNSFIQHWQLCLFYMMVAALAIYAFCQTLLTDN
ncbi:MAG: hypothetical protein PHP01_02040 [Phycisphaerae bacterium]|nr:hypothetical protein [Phycisphaerae bacterium]